MRILQFLSWLPFLILASGHEDDEDWAEIGRAVDSRTFQPELDLISQHASALRNGIPNVIEPGGRGGWGYVAQLQFNDGVTWAAKISNTRNRRAMLQATSVLNVIARSCPGIPVPRVYAPVERLPNSSLIYYISDWITGDSLFNDPEYTMRSSGPSSYLFTLPEKTITQLTEFLYNLTTCRIPFAKCMNPDHMSTC